jgi:hypothetical protein
MAATIDAKGEMPGTSARVRKTRDFISYPRKDSLFANRLVDGVNAREASKPISTRRTFCSVNRGRSASTH